jgi:hypothetical protein
MADEFENVLPFVCCSDVDGVRFIDIDSPDADMRGWGLPLGFNPSFCTF